MMTGMLVFAFVCGLTVGISLTSIAFSIVLGRD